MPIKKDTISDDDISLWSRFLAGDDTAYSFIYQKYAKPLFFQGLQLSSDRELIKDCIHDIFVHLYSNRCGLKPTDSIKLYLFVALRNKLFNAFKKQKIELYPLSQDLENLHDENAKTLEEELISQETESNYKMQVQNVFALLSQRQKEAIHYRFIESMSIDEIGVLMGMNYQSVQNIIQRAIKKIKESSINRMPT